MALAQKLAFFLCLCFVPNYQKHNMTEGECCRKIKGLTVTLYEVETISLCFSQHKP